MFYSIFLLTLTLICWLHCCGEDAGATDAASVPATGFNASLPPTNTISTKKVGKSLVQDMLTHNNWGARHIPAGWKAHSDASGSTFYYNKTINQWALVTRSRSLSRS
jgi:hypothetical protein